jgi:hypothetical protein
MDWDISNGAEGAAVAAIIVFGFVVPLAILAGIVWLVVYLVRRSNTAGPTATPPGTPGPAAAKGDTTGGATAAAAVTSTNATATASPPPPPPPAAPAAPAAPPAPPRTYTPAPPPRPRVPGPGRGGYLGALALAILAAAAVAWMARVDKLEVHPMLAWFALFLVGLGVVLILVSLAGRKLGFLGFISVPLAVLGFTFGFYGDEYREAYQNIRDNIVVDWDEWDDDPNIDEGFDDTFEDAGDVAINAVPAFTADYSQVFFAPACYAADPSDGLAPDTQVARFAFAEFTEDLTLDVVAEYTEISVPVGTNIVLDADGWAQSAVTWPARDVWCDFWDGDQRNFSLINPGSPTLTLTVYDDEYANTIIITETEATPAPVDEEVQP